MIVVWLLRLVMLYLVLRAVSRLLRGIGEGLHGPRDARPRSVALVRDPVCGTFIVPSRAVTAGTGSDTRFFCSENCRRAYSLSSAHEDDERTNGSERTTQ